MSSDITSSWSFDASATSMPQFNQDFACRELREFGLTAFTNPSPCALSAFFVRLDCKWIGNPFERGFQELIPTSRVAARPGSLSSFTGAGAQPMHTDAAYLATPPRYIAFECVNAGESTCKTEAWTTDQGTLLDERPRLLTDPDWVFLGGRQSRFYSPVLDVLSGIARIRFDPYCMSAASGNRTELTDVAELLTRYTQQVSFEWAAGAFLVIDNWRCMHARGEGGECAPSRRLRRWYLGVQNGLGA